MSVLEDRGYDVAPIHLIGEYGNAFSILGRCRNLMRQAKVPKEVQDEFHAAATSGDYNNLLVTVMDWFDLPDDDYDDDEYDD